LTGRVLQPSWTKLLSRLWQSDFQPEKKGLDFILPGNAQIVQFTKTSTVMSNIDWRTVTSDKRPKSLAAIQQLLRPIGRPNKGHYGPTRLEPFS